MKAKNLAAVRCGQRRRRELDSVTAWCLEDHRQLHLLLEALIEATAGPRHPSGVENVVHLLEGLACKLDEHFTREETSELYTSFPAQYPRFAGSLARLREEHGRIRQEISELAGAYRSSGPNPARALDDSLRAAVATIRRHEAEETEILQRVYCEEVASRV